MSPDGKDHHATMRVGGILETCLYADDLEAAAQFYRDVLGLEEFARYDGRHVFFRCGRGCFFLFRPQATLRPEQPMGVPPHGAAGAGHVCFAVPEADLPRWRDQLEQNGVAIERIIDWPRGARSIYLRDPAGNSIELATPKLWEWTESSFFGTGPVRRNPRPRRG